MKIYNIYEYIIYIIYKHIFLLKTVQATITLHIRIHATHTHTHN